MYQTIRNLAVTFQAGVTQLGSKYTAGSAKKWQVNVRRQPCHLLTDEARVYGTVKAMNHSELFVRQAYAAFYGAVESRANQEPLNHCPHLNAALTHGGTGSEGQSCLQDS